MSMENEIESGIVKLSIDGEIGVLTIHTGKKNLITNPEFVDFELLKEWISKNHLKALIITGEGKHFSYGADVERIMDEKGNYSEFERKMDHGKEILYGIEQLPIITIAAINGACFGAGFEIALSCQFRFVANNSFLGLPETNRGLIPGLCGVERLSRLIGEARAIELCLLGKMITADEALQMGIIQSVSDSNNCFDDAKKFIESLILDRTPMQIGSIINSAKNNQRVLPNGEKNMFVEILETNFK